MDGGEKSTRRTLPGSPAGEKGRLLLPTERRTTETEPASVGDCSAADLKKGEGRARGSRRRVLLMYVEGHWNAAAGNTCCFRTHINLQYHVEYGLGPVST